MGSELPSNRSDMLAKQNCAYFARSIIVYESVSKNVTAFYTIKHMPILMSLPFIEDCE